MDNFLHSCFTVIKAQLQHMPSTPGVYRFLDKNENLLYVGKAKNLKNRISSYANASNLTTRILRMISQIATIEITTTHTEAEALLLEANLIRTLQPRYNILLRDDKSFPYIEFSAHNFPQIRKHRGKKHRGARYFGPFANVSAVNKTLALLQRAFLLRPCSDNVFKNRTRPCLQYQIKRCSAPCMDYVNEEEYGTLTQQASDFLQGKKRDIQDALVRDMQAASNAMEFEKAAGLRDRIRALTQVQQEQGMHMAGLGDADIIALARSGKYTCVEVFYYRGGQAFGNQPFFPRHTEEQSDADIMSAFIGQFYQTHAPPKQILLNQLPPETALIAEALSLNTSYKIDITQPQRGDKRELMAQVEANAQLALQRHSAQRMADGVHLEALVKLFGLDDPPSRIEVYDNSHIAGQHAIGAMIMAGPEGFMKQHYRRFNIRNSELTPGDDYAMMREVFTRRFSRLQKDDPDHEKSLWPDLVLIDGGKGQLSAVMQVCEELGVSDVPLVAISKGKERNAGREWIHQPGLSPYQLPPNDANLHYLQRLRDEAHRYAIGSHRIKRAKNITASPLDEISGIGAKRKKALLHHFGSAASVERASLAELEKVAGINKKIAETIYGHFNG